MVEDLELQARGRIIAYLAGKVDGPALQSWLASATWEAERWAPAEAVALVRSLQLLLDEFHHGDWNMEELSSQLRGFVGVVDPTESTLASTGSGSTTVKGEFALPLSGDLTIEWRPAGKSLETAFS